MALIVALPIFAKINTHLMLLKEVGQTFGPLMRLAETAQSKQLPNRRKMAQSDHPENARQSLGTGFFRCRDGRHSDITPKPNAPSH
jgi:hypothetical protein